MAGADARSGLLPFIMLDTYNRLMGHMHQAAEELEAEIEPHRLLRHRLALLLLKQSIQLDTTSTADQSPIHADQVSTCDKDACQHTAQDQHKAVQQACDQVKLTGVDRDAAEIQQAAQTVKQLQQELEQYKDRPMSPAMVHAIVAVVQASRDAEAKTQEDGNLQQQAAVSQLG